MQCRWRRRLTQVVLLVLGTIAALALALWAAQGRLIYPAPHYARHELAPMPPGLTALRDPANPESIIGFYRAPLDVACSASYGWPSEATATWRCAGIRYWLPARLQAPVF
jgi:hypothetical protein